MDEQVRTRLDDTRRALFEHFDEDVHQRLRLQLADAQARLDRVGGRFWSVTRFMLDGRARFDDASLNRSLEQNNTHFNEARDKLERWADDMVLSVEKALLDTKQQIKALRRHARQAVTLTEQHEIQDKLQKLERRQRRQRQEIFKAEDEIIEKRDTLIDALERQLAQRTETETLFTIRWAVT